MSLFYIGQLIEFNTENEKWVSGKISQASLDPNRWCIKLDKVWKDDDEWWVPDSYLRHLKK